MTSKIEIGCEGPEKGICLGYSCWNAETETSKGIPTERELSVFKKMWICNSCPGAALIRKNSIFRDGEKKKKVLI